MKLMGIDYGSKRVGIALSDEEGRMAFPHSVLENDSTLLDTLEKLIRDGHVVRIIMGHSIDLNGTPNALQRDIEEMSTKLTLRTGLPVELHPEHFTTQEAKHIQGKTDKIDASAATLLLNSYIQMHS